MEPWILDLNMTGVAPGVAPGALAACCDFHEHGGAYLPSKVACALCEFCS